MRSTTKKCCRCSRRSAWADEAKTYLETVIERFSNPFLDHRLSEIFTNHEAKKRRRFGGLIDLAKANDARVSQPRLEGRARRRSLAWRAILSPRATSSPSGVSPTPKPRRKRATGARRRSYSSRRSSARHTGRRLGSRLAKRGRSSATSTPRREAFRMSLVADPADAQGATARLALIGRARRAAALPQAYVARLFDDYAPRFDAHLTKNLGYRAPALIADALSAVAPGRRFASALDLGCGTGLMGEALRGRVDHLTGVDLSAAMIAKARERGVYDGLIVGDAAALLDVRAAGAPSTSSSPPTRSSISATSRPYSPPSRPRWPRTACSRSRSNFSRATASSSSRRCGSLTAAPTSRRPRARRACGRSSSSRRRRGAKRARTRQA